MPHLAGLVVLERLDELNLGVHDKRAIARDRLPDRLAAQDQKQAALTSLNDDRRPSPLADDQFRFSGIVRAICRHQTSHDEEGRSMPIRQKHLCTSSGDQLQIIKFNRRHRPGRGLEALRYRFEIVSDYGAFRDLQRHRMLTVQWQRLGPHLGAGVPGELEAAGVADAYRRALDVSRAEWERLAGDGHEGEALYALCLGYRIRFVLDLNAREAMQLIELRSGREGHPSYRAVAHEMHRQIEQVHPAVAGAMTYVDRDTEPRLERILSEMRTQAKLDALSAR